MILVFWTVLMIIVLKRPKTNRKIFYGEKDLKMKLYT